MWPFNGFKPVKLTDLDIFSYREIAENHPAWNFIRYPVNARLEFELIRRIEQGPAEEVRRRFNPRSGHDQDIHVNWAEFHGVYIPSCYLEPKTNPEACLDSYTVEFLRVNRPEELHDGTCVSALFARDDLNSLYPRLLSKDETLDPRMQRNIDLAERVYGNCYGGIESEEKIRRLFEESEYRSDVRESSRAMLDYASENFDKYKKDIRDRSLRILIKILITHYQKEMSS